MLIDENVVPERETAALSVTYTRYFSIDFDREPIILSGRFHELRENCVHPWEAL